MKNVLISSFDMEVGGVERSLISMLNKFDYENFKVDLMLYSHTGEFMDLLPDSPNLLNEVKAYKTFRMSIGEILKSGNLPIGIIRLFSKYKANASLYEIKFLPPYMAKNLLDVPLGRALLFFEVIACKV